MKSGAAPSAEQDRALWFALAVAAALIAAPWRGHVDDVDAQLYAVLVRNLARDHAWLDLRYLPGLLPHFREHLPFGFWPGAAALRLLGEWAVAPAYGLLTWLTVLASARIAARLGGPWAGVAGALALGTCESIWQYGGRVLLEPPLLLLTTLSVGAVLRDRPRWGLAALWAALAVLVKGPFGMLPLACVAIGLGPRAMARGALACAAAAVPIALFLWLDGGDWSSGYYRRQLLASATGARLDGITLWWFPLLVIAGRFWPGLPFALAGGLRRDRRGLAIACLAIAALLCLPQRKWGNHAYVAFPLLAILAGLGAARIVERFPRWLLPAAAALAWALALGGAGRLVLQPPCIVHAELAAELSGLPRGAPLLLVSPQVDWLLVGELASERDLVPWPQSALPASGVISHHALVRDGTALVAPWRAVARARGWTLAQRQ